MSAERASSAAQPRDPGPPRGWELGGLGLLVAGLSAAHLLWFHWDTRIPFWDQRRYWEMAWASASNPWSLDLHPSHPPLFSWVGARLAQLFSGGNWEGHFGVLQATNTLWAVAIPLLSYQLARRLGHPRAALPSAWIAGLAPLGFGLAHLYYLEQALVVVCVGTWLALAPTRALHSPKRCLAIGALAAAGALVKWTYPVFVLVPGLLAILRDGPLQRRTWLGVAIALGTGTLLAGPWYWSHAEGIADFLGRGVTGLEGHLSARSGWSGWLHYPQALVTTALGPGLAILAFVGGLVLLRRRRLQALALSLCLALPLLVFGAILTKKVRHLAPLIPLFALAAGVALAAIRSPLRRRLALGTTVLWLLLLSAHVGFGLWPSAPRLEWGERSLPLLADAPPPGAPQSPDWPYQAIIAASAAATTERGPDESGHVRGLLAFNRPSFREDGFLYQEVLGGERIRAIMVAQALPLPEGGLVPFPFEAGWRAPALPDAAFLIAKSAPVWVRFAGRDAAGKPVPAHLHGARLCEAALDPDGEIAKCFQRVQSWRAGSGLVHLLLPRPSPDRTASLARFTLRWSPDHAAAWAALGFAAPPAGPLQAAQLEALRLLPTGWPSDARAYRSTAEAGALVRLREHWERAARPEDLALRLEQLARLHSGSAEAALLNTLERRAALLTRYRLQQGAFEAALDLAELDLADRDLAPRESARWLGLDASARRWARRGLEADLEASRIRLAALAPDANWPPPPKASTGASREKAPEELRHAVPTHAVVWLAWARALDAR